MPSIAWGWHASTIIIYLIAFVIPVAVACAVVLRDERRTRGTTPSHRRTP